MGVKEAERDNIRYDKSNPVLFYIPCCVCGEEVQSLNYRRGFKYCHDKCREIKKLSDKLNKSVYSK